jgi:hypothetical protein
VQWSDWFASTFEVLVEFLSAHDGTVKENLGQAVCLSADCCQFEPQKRTSLMDPRAVEQPQLAGRMLR